MPRATLLLLAAGLLVSAALLAAVGGWWGVALGAAQAAVGGAIAVRPDAIGGRAAACLLCVPAPFAAIRHWTARLPGACRCARLPQPPPGLVSWIGLAVALDLVLLGATLWVTARCRAEVGKSSP